MSVSRRATNEDTSNSVARARARVCVPLSRPLICPYLLTFSVALQEGRKQVLKFATVNEIRLEDLVYEVCVYLFDG